MIPNKHAVFAAVFAAACSSAPVSYFGVTPPGRETAYQCAVAQLNLMGYTIEDGNEDAGFVRGRKQTSGLGMQIITGSTYHDVLTASAFDNPATGDTTLRVVATRISDQDAGLLGLGGNPEEGEDVLAPSDSGKFDAQQLLTGCGATTITGPPRGAEAYSLEGATALNGGGRAATDPADPRSAR